MMTSTQRAGAAAAIAMSVFAWTREAAAEQGYALVVFGAHGGKQYEETYARWRETLVSGLRDLGIDGSRLILLADRRQDPSQVSSAANVRKAFARLRGTLSKDDLLMVILVGHGTFDGVDAKFNLVGPDLEAAEWDQLLRTVPARRTIIVNTTAASAPFLERLAMHNRIVIAATDSAAQRYDTVFPEFFAAAFKDPASDGDKNGRVSIWEAFVYASAAVRRWYEQRGQLPTERAMLDDDGDGIGRDAEMPGGTDGTLAQSTYLDISRAIELAQDPSHAALVARKRALEREIDELKLRKAELDSKEYTERLEKLLVELALVSREIRSKSE